MNPEKTEVVNPLDKGKRGHHYRITIQGVGFVDEPTIAAVLGV